MRVLIVGQGGREHALAWKVAQSPRLEKLYIAPGNPGMAQLGQCIDLAISSSSPDVDDQIERLADFALKKEIDLTIVGPEDILDVGLVDRFSARGLKTFGPTAAAARIESSKAFAKDLMQSIGVPTAGYRIFNSYEDAAAYIRQHGAPIVVKASGLAAGKGAVVCHTEDEALNAAAEMLEEGILGASGSQIVIEEFMDGDEASLFAITDGQAFITMVPAQDHKAIFEGDKGPNTGGMGAYAPAPIMTPELVQLAEDTIIRPVLDELRARGAPFQGVLYCGLMFTNQGPKVVEFNCRFGDPEAQVVLPLLKTDLLDIAEAVSNGNLADLSVENSGQAAACVVVASKGYPGDYPKGLEITGLENLNGNKNIIVFHAATTHASGTWRTAGGRVLGITALGDDIASAIARAYEGIDKIHFEGIYCRRDIGYKALNR
jgi:phosphoribosylamine--glycine ligase